MIEPTDLFVLPDPLWSNDTTNVPVTSIAYSPNGTSIAYSNFPGAVTVANVADGFAEKTLSQKYTQHPLVGCFFHPVEDDYLFSVFKDGHILLYDVQTGEIIKMTRHLGSNIVACSFDPFGEVFAIGCADGSIRVYDIENMQRTKALVKMTGRSATNQASVIYDLIYHSEDSNYILSAVGSDRVLLWDTRSGSSERAIIGPHIRGHGIAMYDGHVITASYRDTKQLEIWDFGTAKKIKEVPINGNLSNVSISRNGLDMVATVSGQNIGVAFAYENTKDSIGQTHALKANPSALAVSPMGTSFVIGSEQGDMACYQVRLRSQ